MKYLKSFAVIAAATATVAVWMAVVVWVDKQPRGGESIIVTWPPFSSTMKSVSSSEKKLRWKGRNTADGKCHNHNDHDPIAIDKGNFSTHTNLHSVYHERLAWLNIYCDQVWAIKIARKIKPISKSQSQVEVARFSLDVGRSNRWLEEYVKPKIKARLNKSPSIKFIEEIGYLDIRSLSGSNKGLEFDLELKGLFVTHPLLRGARLHAVIKAEIKISDSEDGLDVVADPDVDLSVDEDGLHIWPSIKANVIGQPIAEIEGKKVIEEELSAELNDMLDDFIPSFQKWLLDYQQIKDKMAGANFELVKVDSRDQGEQIRFSIRVDASWLDRAGPRSLGRLPNPNKGSALAVSYALINKILELSLGQNIAGTFDSLKTLAVIFGLDDNPVRQVEGAARDIWNSEGSSFLKHIGMELLPFEQLTLPVSLAPSGEDHFVIAVAGVRLVRERQTPSCIQFTAWGEWEIPLPKKFEEQGIEVPKHIITTEAVNWSCPGRNVPKNYRLLSRNINAIWDKKEPWDKRAMRWPILLDGLDLDSQGKKQKDTVDQMVQGPLMIKSLLEHHIDQFYKLIRPGSRFSVGGIMDVKIDDLRNNEDHNALVLSVDTLTHKARR